MNKKEALLISLSITLLISINLFYFTNAKSEIKLEKVTVARVIDGDTLVLTDNRTLRLLNINSPEKDSTLAHYSYDYLKEFEDSQLNIQITEKDKYNRYLARLYSQNKAYLNLDMVKKGFALKFLVDSSELRQFKEAE